MNPREPAAAPLRAVVLAGGKGTRLQPYTAVLPKPLLPVGDQPILERVLRQLRDAGFHRVTISVGHLAELIRVFFGDGARWGLQIDYAIEDEPLGTIGPLAFIQDLGEHFLVVTGDVLTDLDFGTLWRAHANDGATLTIATYRREVHIDFGVLRYGADRRITEFSEKPVLPYDVSMGVYILSRRCLDFVPRGKPFGFDQLVLALLEAGETIRAFPHQGQWLDLGRQEDYARANREYNHL